MADHSSQLSEAADEAVKRDFIYAGRRTLQSDKTGHCLYPIGEDGELLNERLFDLGTKFKGIIGGRYTGATFGNKSSFGVVNARLISSWPDRSLFIDWESEDRAAEIEAASRRMRSDLKRQSELDAILLPIRKRLYAARRRGDIGTAAAIRSAVVASIDKPPRKDEE